MRNNHKTRILEPISKVILKRGRAKSLWARLEVKRARRRTEVRREPFSPTTQSHGLCSRPQPKGVLKWVPIISIVMGLPALSFSASIEGQKNGDGSFKKWHRIEVVFDGPQVNESSATFRNFGLDVTFTSPSGRAYQVPGFFDADGDPANSSASSGNKWKTRFAGGQEATCRYGASFVTGTNVAANLTGGTGGAAPDGETGTFKIGPQDKSGKDFRAKGKLEYVGEHYLRFADGDYFIKLGANSPEVLLEYGEFDGTPGHDNDLYSPQWYNPRTGGSLTEDHPKTVSGGGANVSLGTPPNTLDQDWVVLLRNRENI